MSSNPDYNRDYGHEYDIESAKRRKQRAARNRAHRIYLRSYGVIPSGFEVDHKLPLSKGGTNSKANLRLQRSSTNRSYPRNSDGSMKSGSY